MENWCHVCTSASFLVVETFNWFSKQFKLIATANFNSQSIVEIPPIHVVKITGFKLNNWTFQCLVLSITWEATKVRLGVDICWNKFWNPLWFREPEFCTNFNGSSNEFIAILWKFSNWISFPLILLHYFGFKQNLKCWIVTNNDLISNNNNDNNNNNNNDLIS